MIDNFVNFGKASVSTGYNSSVTSIVLTSGEGTKLPTPPFNAVWFNNSDYFDPTDDPNREIVRVTVVATDTLTITRGQEGTTAKNHNTSNKNYKLIAGLTAKTLNTDINLLKYRYYIGTKGQFATLQALITYLAIGGNMVGDVEALVDSGSFDFSDTLAINLPYKLHIRGLSFEGTIFRAVAGLTNKPMFSLTSDVCFSNCTLIGSTLASWGTLTTENLINVVGTVYHEFTGMLFDTAYKAIHVSGNASIFVFNNIIKNCTDSGVCMDSVGASQLDIEVTNLENCGKGVHLQKGVGSHFVITNVIFINGLTQKSVFYEPSTYGYVDGPSITGNTWNGVGEFLDGFDFSRTDGRDANVFVDSNAGIESKAPHAKVNIVDNTVTTTISTGNTYYLLNGINAKMSIVFNVAATSGNFSITYHGQTTGNIAWNASAATIKADIEALSNVTTVTVVQIVASKEWTVEFLTAGEGFEPPFTVNLGTLSPTASVVVTPNYYVNKILLLNNKLEYLSSYGSDCMLWISGNLSCDQPNRNINIGIKKNNTGSIIAPMTCRTATQNIAYSFSMVVYLEDVKDGDYYQLFVTSPTNSDVVQLWDLQLLWLTN